MIKIHGSSGIELPNNYSIKSDSGDLKFNHDTTTIAKATSEHFEEFNRPICAVGHHTEHTSYSGNQLKLEQIIIDTHNGYNTGTGYYTVPLAGKYLCLCSLFIKLDGDVLNHASFKPYRNGNWYPDAQWCHSQYNLSRSYETLTGNWILEGEYGDTFGIGVYTQYSSQIYGGNYHQLNFIYLSS